MFNTKKDSPDHDLELFSIYDSKVGNYREPMFAINQYDLLRTIQNDFTKPEVQKAPIFTNAEDFSVFKVGTFTKKTGHIGSQQPEHIVNLHEIRAIITRSIPLRNDALRDVSQQNLGIEPT